MATSEYIRADIAQIPMSVNSDVPKQTIPRRSKWPAIKNVLKKSRPAEDVIDGGRIEMKTPDFHSTLTPFYQCFHDAVSLIKLLDDLKRQDSDLTGLLEGERVKRRKNATQQTLEEDREISFEATNRVSTEPYIDFLGAFVTLFLQSRFLHSHHEISATDDPYQVLTALSLMQCPEELYIFRRVFVSPHQIASKFREGQTPERYNDIPTFHLAKFLDVVVVNFLSSVGEHTKPSAVKWALEYLLKLLRDLYNSFGLLGTPGWYGAPPIRSRKRTATNRPSVVRPPILPPPLVVVGTPPTSPPQQFTTAVILDPETGQHSPHPSPNLGGLHSTGGLHSGPSSLSPRSPSNGPLSLSPRHESPSGTLSFIEGLRVSPSRPNYTPRSPNRSRESSPIDVPSSDTRHTRSHRSASPPVLGSIKEDDVIDNIPEIVTTERSTSPPDEVRSKVKSPEMPEFDKESELSSGVTGEGRVSLVAVLTAISNLPQSENLWNHDVGEKCFSLIQLCLDLGLPSKQHHSPSPQPSQAQNRRQKFKAQDNPAFSKHGTEKPSVLHAKSVIEASVRALIQCATALFVGCANEGTVCSLSHLRLPHQSHAFHSRLMRLLQRIDDHSPVVFRETLSKFSQPSNSTARRLFHFLHVILQYCSWSSDLHGSNSVVVDIVIAVLRSAVDRLVDLDITEPSIQNSVVSEACSFFQYAHGVLEECSLSHISGAAHLEMYLHRIALSIILPPPPQRPDPPLISPKLKDAASPLIPARLRGSKPQEVTSPTELNKAQKSSTLPSEKMQSPVVAAVVKQAQRGLGDRTRSGSLNLPSDSAAVKPKAKFRKQQSLLSDIGRGSVPSVGCDSPSIASRPSGASDSLPNDVFVDPNVEWRGLKLELLRGRIQRLVVLLNTTVPGTVPDPDMLASLVDLCDGKTVVARAMVLLECAMFVSKLRTQELPTVWVIHNKEHNAHLMHSVSHKLTKWGEAIGDRLRVIELRERELRNRVRIIDEASSEGPAIREEPIFPPDETFEDTEYTVVSYAIKMSACQLLLEITRFLRDPPQQFCGWSVNRISTARLSSVFADDLLERKPSVSSTQSSDSDTLPVPGAAYSSLPSKEFFQRYNTSTVGRFGSNLSAEDAEPPVVRQNSVEDNSGSASPTKKRVSVYLRVNSTGGGTISRSSSLRRAPKVIRVVDSPSQVRANTQSTIHSRREALTASTVNALHQSLYTGHSRGRRPSVAGVVGSVTVASHHPLPAKYRRQSVGTLLYKQTSMAEQDRTTPTEQPSSKTSTTGATLTSLWNRGRKAMHTLRRRPTKTRLSSEKVPSPGSSPGHRRKLFSSQRSRDAGSFSSAAGAPEDRSLPCSWLGIIEHLVVVKHSASKDTRLQHTLACKQLVLALKRVYSAKFVDEVGSDTKASTVTRSLSLMFTNRIQSDKTPSLVSGSSQSRGFSVASDNLSKKRSYDSRRASSVPYSMSKQRSQESFGPLSKLSFARMSAVKFSSTFMSAGETEESIELFLEAESTYPHAYLDAELDKQRHSYLSSELLGMIHVPFSILVHAAPALHPNTLSRLKPIAWNALLDSDAEQARAAGAFFLLACLKESSSNIKGFVKEKVTKGGPKQQREAIRRFLVLWETRYHVWPRMEDRAQKKLGANDKKTQSSDDLNTIGYSLPATLLGQMAVSLPLAPWEPSAVCTNKTCADNPDLCYRSTQHVPVVHAEEVTDAVKDYTVSGICLLQEASSQPANVFLGIGDEDDIGNIEKWEAVKTTLFPHSLLPLTRFVIMTLKGSSHAHTCTPSLDTPTQLDMHELATQVVWQCMLQDEYLFFQPLLDQFNKLYIFIKENTSKTATDIDKLLAEIVEPFHVLLQSYHSLPSRAAHFLFNNFVGVVMKHTDQPVAHSSRIIQSVLTLIGMVVPSVQGLDSKVLKNSLKKENCYTTVMTTARIRGVEKVYVVDLIGGDQKLHYISDGMTFGNLIAMARGQDRVTLGLLNNWYLLDSGKDVPLLSSLYIQDQYSTPLDGQYPHFYLKGATHADHLWARQMDQLFVHKMSELMRVQFSMQLLHTGPGVEKGVVYSEYAQPNHQFIHKELVELTSFPRKALTSILQEAGQGALQHYPLHASDVMLKGTWVRFVLELFKAAKPDFNWQNSMVLFLNVINGALLLHGENHAILRVCLVTLLTAAAKFSTVFKRDGYQMIVPVLIQVYALHMENTLITRALQFLFYYFYVLDGNTFISQMAASASTLFSDSVASLSSKVSSSYTPLPPAPPQMEGEVVRKFQVRAVFQLIQALDIAEPMDNLDVLPCCQQHLDEASLARLDPNGQRLSLVNGAALLITLSAWNPEALRGMQVLVCMDNLILQFLKTFSSTSPLSLLKSLEYLIKGCEVIARHHQFRRDISTRKGAGKEYVALDPQTPGYPADKTFRLPDIDEIDDAKPKSTSTTRKVSMVIQNKFRRLVNPDQKGQGVKGNTSESSLPERDVRRREPPGSRSGVLGIDHGIITSQFKLRRLQLETQQILLLSRDSLLSIATQFVAHFAKVRISEVGSQRGMGIGRRLSYQQTNAGSARQDRVKVTFESSSVQLLTFVAIQLIKQGYSNDRFEGVLHGRGLIGFMTCLLPNIEWTEGYFTAFSNLLNKLIKFFKYLQKESSKAMLVWDSLTGFISGLTLTIHNSPQLVQGQEQHLQKMKSLLEAIVSVSHTGGGNPQNQSASALRRTRSMQRIQTPLLQGAPVSFSEAVVGLAVELVVLTHALPTNRLRYHMSDLLYHKIIRENEELLMSKVVLPVCIQLGLRDDLERPCLRDAEFVLHYIHKNVEFVIKRPSIMNQKLPPEPFFRDLKVVCLAFSETFTLQHWHQISQWVISLTRRKALVLSPPKVPILTTDEGAGASVRASRLSSISNTSQTGHGSNTALLESFLFYHDHLLRFFETFLILYHTPLLSLLSPLLTAQKTQLQTVLSEAKSESPALINDVNQYIDRCQALLSSGFNSMASMSRHQLLQTVNDNLRLKSLPTRVQRSNTSVSPVKAPSVKKLRRRRSYTAFTQPPLSKIGEEDQDSDLLLQSSTLPKRFESLSPEHRPGSLKWKGKSVPKSYVPPQVPRSKPPSSLSLADNEGKKQSSSPRKPRRKAHLPKMASLATPDATGRKRAPRLGKLGKFGSSECHADIEDAEDTTSPDRMSANNPLHHNEEYILENLASLSAESSPNPPKRHIQHDVSSGGGVDGGNSLLVAVEVHENPSIVEAHSPVRAVDSNESTHSAVCLLSDGNYGNSEEEEAEFGYSQSLPTSSRLNAKRGSKVSFSKEVGVSPSMERRAGSGLSLGSALKESSQYVYRNLGKGTNFD